MYSSFKDVIEKVKCLEKVTISVAAAQDEEVMMAVQAVYEQGLASAILVGDASLIRPMAVKYNLPADITIIDEPDVDKAALKAVGLVRTGRAQVLMKGLINSSNYLRAVLNQDHGLRSGSILSHLAVFEIPGEKKLAFHADGGMNVAPTLADKKAILINTLKAVHQMGIEMPKVAVLTANEQVSPKMIHTVEAKALVDMGANGELPPCIIEGPIAFDVATTPEAAKHKGIVSQVSGDVDVFLLPNIEAGNILGKSLVKYAHAKFAGLVLGATNPIILTSRSDTFEAKINSLALACLMASNKK